MIFLHDTRDKSDKHPNVDPVLEKMGHKVVRSKMYVGDITLLNKQDVCIDLKANLSEVETNLVHQHARFRNECKRAQDAGIKLVILVEEDNIPSLECVPKWVNPRYKRWIRLKTAHKQGKQLQVKIAARPPVTGQALYGMMCTMSRRYGVTWLFTPHSDTAKTICNILGVMEDDN